MKFNLKKVSIAVIILAAVIILEFTGILQYTAARVSTTIYVNIKYSDRGFRFQTVEFAPQFGEYDVIFADKNSKTVGFTVIPKFFPVIISTDPLDFPV